MSEARRIDRRTLFDAFRRTNEAPTKTATFSLARFYERRTDGGEVTCEIPPFALREDLPAVKTVPAFAEPIGPAIKRPT